MVNPIPEGYPRVTPYLIVDGASAAIDFYKSVLGATERMRMGGPEGKVGHAELEIGDSVVMLADEHPEVDARGPKSVGGTPVTLHVYVEEADRVFERAIEAGARALRPVEDQFYGDRLGSFEIPSDITGTSPPTSRTWRRRRCRSASRRRRQQRAADFPGGLKARVATTNVGTTCELGTRIDHSPAVADRRRHAARRHRARPGL
jgi:PhnB protein